VAGKEERWERSVLSAQCSVHKHNINNKERGAERKSEPGFFVDESVYSYEMRTSDRERETGPNFFIGSGGRFYWVQLSILYLDLTVECGVWIIIRISKSLKGTCQNCDGICVTTKSEVRSPNCESKFLNFQKPFLK
jgi:hypothetical protein